MTATATLQPNRRGLVLVSAAAVALLSTAAAYSAMVAFGHDVLAMNTTYAAAFAGVFELSLVTVALMAREAAQADRPNSTLLVLTWILSGASGLFAGWQELHHNHPVPAAIFRLCVPLLAALMWHLALIGDRHLAMARSWSELRTGARMHALLLSTEAWHRAHLTHAEISTRRTARRLVRADARRLRARSVALRTVAPAEMELEVAQWLAAVDAVNHGTLHVATRTVTAPPGEEIERPRHVSLPAVRQPLTVTPDTEPDTAPTSSTAGSDSAVSDDSPADTDPDSLPSRAVALRSAGVTVPEVAAELGVSERSVYRWTNTKSSPTTATPALGGAR